MRDQTIHYQVTVTLAHADGKAASRSELTKLISEVLEICLEEEGEWHTGNESDSCYVLKSATIEVIDEAKARWLSDNPPKIPQTVRVKSDDVEPFVEPLTVEQKRKAKLDAMIPTGNYRIG